MKDFDFLIQLEKSLHSFEVRSDRRKISLLLSPKFFEYGSSGRVWTLDEILNRLPTEDAKTQIKSDDFKATPLAGDVVLLTYLSSRVENGASAVEFLRSSIWRKNSAGWQMEFHQGTKKQPVR